MKTETTNTLSAIGIEDAEYYLQKGIDLLLDFGPKLLLAILVLIIGLWLIRIVRKATRKIMIKRDVEPSLQSFLNSFISIALKALLFISVISMVGVEMTSFIALLGAAGLAVGMALSGTLQNFAGGIMILIFKPYKVGDFIDAQGYTGTVKEILIFNTILTTPDNRTIIIPNGPLSTGTLTNFSTQDKRRVDLSFGIGYNDDIDKAKEVLWSLINADERIMKDPEPFVAVSELGDSSVNFVVRLWCEPANYWPIHFSMIENVKKAFDKEGVSIPFPQRDVHIYNH